MLRTLLLLRLNYWLRLRRNLDLWLWRLVNLLDRFRCLADLGLLSG